MICKLSRFYGSDPSIVLAGGGNTSCKVGNRLFVKASGTSLATMTPDGFVAMDRDRLEDARQRDARRRSRHARSPVQGPQSRRHGASRERGQRPSVEVLLHHLLPGTYVVHSHATIANTLTCHKNGRRLAEEIFGNSIIWLPYVDPGFTLAQSLKQALAEHQSRYGRRRREGHSDGESRADRRWRRIRMRFAPTRTKCCDKIAARLGDDWATDVVRPADAGERRRTNVSAKSRPHSAACLPRQQLDIAQDRHVRRLARSPKRLSAPRPARRPRSPGRSRRTKSSIAAAIRSGLSRKTSEDEAALVARLRAAIDEHKRRTRFAPKIVLVEGVGLFAVGDDFKQANTVRDVYLDAVKVMAGATRLGGDQLSHRPRAAIHRRLGSRVVSPQRFAGAAAAAAARLKGKVAIVTGAAQGFGLEIARGLAAEGAYVALADVNEAGVTAAASEIAAAHGAGAALGLAMNVTDSESIQRAIDAVVRTYGGFDVFISNAGVLRAESVKTQSEARLRFRHRRQLQRLFPLRQSGRTGARHAASREPGLLERHHSDQLEVGPRRLEEELRLRRQQVRRHRAHAVVCARAGRGRHQSERRLPRQFSRRPAVVRSGEGFVRAISADRQSSRREDDRRREAAYEAKVPMGRGCTTADVLKAILYLDRTAVRNRPGTPRDRRPGNAAVTFATIKSEDQT